jgi:N-acetylglucosamine kinase-like BadF-type ATPase
MILLADSGTSKCDWVFVDNLQHDRYFEIQTVGLNPTYYTENEITGIINNNNDFLSIKSHVEKIYFFGSGCGLPEVQEKMKEVLSRSFFKAKEIYVAADTEAAIYACTEGPAVVSILGTGSNCCYFDGTKAEYRIPSLGYLLMDDGGGNRIGRSCHRAYFYDKMPGELKEKFSDRYSLDVADIRKKLYSEGKPSQFMASFAPFVFENKAHEFMSGLIKEELTAFFDNVLAAYDEELKNYKLHFAGSVAHHGREWIESLCESKGIELGHIVERPIVKLAEKVDHLDKYLSQKM